MMKPASLVVTFRSFMGEGARIQYLFNDGDSARAAQDLVAEAARKYHDRANDRERLVTFEAASGPTTLDVSELLAVGVDDPFARGMEATEAWNLGLGASHGRMEKAKTEAARLDP